MRWTRLLKANLLNENSLGEPISDNEQTLQKFWNWFDGSKIVKNGKPLVCYHYTNNSFDTFDKSKISKGQGDMGFFGKGFYFTGRGDFGKSFGKNRFDCYLNLKNPMNFDKFSTTSTDAYNTYNFLEYLDKNKKIKSFAIYYGQDDDYYSNRQYDIEPKDINFNKIHQGLLQDFSEIITNYAKLNNFDGIVSDNGFTEIVAFESNQIKSIKNNSSYSVSNNSIYGSTL